MKLSVVLAVQNEQNNIKSCLLSVKSIADEIIVVDDGSIDKTIAIARECGAKVYEFKHTTNFHQTKQFAIEKAKGDWILQLDADERVSKELAIEIQNILNNNDDKIRSRKIIDLKKWKLFQRHEKIIRQRDGSLGKETGEICAFFIPRINYFVGKPLKHAGVYPDAVIRLIKQGKARLPAKSVHELMEVDGEIAWLFNDLEHHESPTLDRYLYRADRYTSITAGQMEKVGIKKNKRKFMYFSFIKPTYLFVMLFIRHKGYKDGIRGFLWSAYSAMHFPLAYWKYWVGSIKS
ncbi:glycosyltransferase family 2 protein [Candidatus Woesebacteria bacterium]|nr:MAG: glycosyltransferase family 2 protein [Candidatus Woesebacteria bacterium]